MCGIIGFSGSFDAARLRHASGLQGHRGPDSSGEFIDAEAGMGLGHVRLSILDLSVLGNQPMSSPDGSVVLVFNGEIYNFRELRKELETHGCSFRGNSDTEVLLQLYLGYGEGMLGRLNGDFAFALWDKRDQTLFVARDAGCKAAVLRRYARRLRFRQRDQGAPALGSRGENAGHSGAASLPELSLVPGRRHAPAWRA